MNRLGIYKENNYYKVRIINKGTSYFGGSFKHEENAKNRLVDLRSASASDTLSTFIKNDNLLKKQLNKAFTNITPELLTTYTTYDEENGKFYWKTTVSDLFEAGEPLSCSVSGDHYEQVCLLNTQYKTHRLAFVYKNNLNYKEVVNVDHIDHNPTNNSFKNLRITSHSFNMKNKKRYKNNVSGITGVYPRKNDKFAAHIGNNGKSIYLGLFDSIDEAINARKTAEIEYCFDLNHGI